MSENKKSYVSSGEQLIDNSFLIANFGSKIDKNISSEGGLKLTIKSFYL